MIDLTPILQAVIALAATVVTCWLVPLLRCRLGQSRFEKLTAVVETLVSSEQFVPNDTLLDKDENRMLKRRLEEMAKTD